MSVQLTVFDGARCIGGNKIYLAADGTGLFFDFGLNYSLKNRFFDEFLRPRSGLGLVDYLSTGLLPPIPSIYREDLIPPGVDLWSKFPEGECGECQPQAILLSHAHSDHLQMISFVGLHIPIYTSLTTAVMAKARQDTSSGGFESETTSIIPKEAWEGLLRSKHYRTSPALGRPYVVADGDAVLEGVQEFWSTSASSRALASVPLKVFPGQVGHLKTQYFPVDHSIPGSGAWAVETSEGWIVYTGDLRLHGSRKEESLHFIEAAARLEPLALICEGTHLENESFMTEAAVYENARLAVELSQGLVMADFSPSNIERLNTFHQIALDTDRVLVITFKDAYLLEALEKAGATVPNLRGSSPIMIYGPNKVTLASFERVLAEKHGRRLIGAQEIQREPGSFILCFGYYELPNLVDIDPATGHYIHSSSEPYQEQMVLDMARLQAWLRRFNIENVVPSSSFHSSGHLSGNEILYLVERIRPRYLIPVHTEKPHTILQRVQRRMGKAVQTILPKDGIPIELKGPSPY